MWVQAKHIAKETLDGKIWLRDIGHATHYHAYWVRPSWVHEMTKLYKLGVHTFYRPRAWGNGELRAGLGHAAEHLEGRCQGCPDFVRFVIPGAPRSGELANRIIPVHDEFCANRGWFPDSRAARGFRNDKTSHLDIETDVEILHRVRKRAGRQIVDAGFGDRGGGRERDAARSLDDEAACHHLDGTAHRRRIEIVDQHHVGAADREHFFKL